MNQEVDKRLAELAAKIRGEVDALARPGERWTVNDGPRISVTLWNPRDPSSGRGKQIDASNCDDLGSVMESLRREWADRAHADDDYAKELLGKAGI